MKPEAIMDAAVELLTEIESADTPANEIINRYTRSRRYIGSKDRRQLTDLVWTYIRHRARLSYFQPKRSLAEQVRYLAEVGTKDISVIEGAPAWVNNEVPEWLIPIVPQASTELPALLLPAPVVLRANGSREEISRALAAEGIETTPTPLSPYGLYLKKRCQIQATKAYREGLVEVQDEGSQCVALETHIKAGERVLDYCAGAGGKSLIFAQMMQDKGVIVAHDISDISLRELQKRAARAHVTCICVQKPLKAEVYDHVVVDAPCSGTGTWRRCPDRRWKLTQAQFQALVEKQADILDVAATYVRCGGRLSYMTCSLTYPENTDQAQRFIARHPDFTLVNERAFTPATTQTDGLYIATFQKKN